jgi:hypothetical protein
MVAVDELLCSLLMNTQSGDYCHQANQLLIAQIPCFTKDNLQIQQHKQHILKNAKAHWLVGIFYIWMLWLFANTTVKNVDQ